MVRRSLLLLLSLLMLEAVKKNGTFKAFFLFLYPKVSFLNVVAINDPWRNDRYALYLFTPFPHFSLNTVESSLCEVTFYGLYTVNDIL